MSLNEIKAAIPKLTPREQAELDLWLQEREEEATRRVHFLELRAMLEESQADFEAGRFQQWTSETMNEIRAEARRNRAATQNPG
jgi:hypothetical protein